MAQGPEASGHAPHLCYRRDNGQRRGVRARDKYRCQQRPPLGSECRAHNGDEQGIHKQGGQAVSRNGFGAGGRAYNFGQGAEDRGGRGDERRAALTRNLRPPVDREMLAGGQRNEEIEGRRAGA